MTTESPQPQEIDATPRADIASADEARLQQLRGLLLGPEIDKIAALHRRLDDPQVRSEDLSHSIAEAIALRARQDQKLQATLQPLIEEALRISVARDPAMLATSLFPIIGEAVRKAVAHALQGMFDSLNLMLSRGLSFESWKWRFEAWRTGKSFGQVALTHSLSYRVEQVFLIHRETGLLLGHVTASNAVVQDADLVSGMLTAIQDFVRDSFGPKKDELEVMQVGEFKLWLQHGPLALLAAVVSGQPPPELREVFEREVEAIHQQYTPALTNFSGDTATLPGVDVYLRRCLLGAQQKVTSRRSRGVLWVVFAVILLLIAGLAALRIRNTHRWNTYVQRLQSEPGVTVIQHQRHWFSFEISGLRDPLATDPASLLASYKVPAQKVSERWQPYISLDPKFGAARRISEDISRVERNIIRFDLNSAQIPNNQYDTIDAAAENIRTLERTAADNHRALRLSIGGHTDATGKETHNAELSRDRAQSVLTALLQRGVPAEMLSPAGLADSHPQHADANIYPHELDRRVTFTVTLTPQPGAAQ